MILCLTYHKILEASGSAGDVDFYSVTRDNLVSQIQATLAAGFTPFDLTQTKPRIASGDRQFILTFDDGTADHYEIVFPVLQELGLPGIFFVPTAKLNRPGYLTDAQVREMAQAGQTIGLHGHEHRRLDRTTDDEMRNQFQRSRDSLTRLTGEPPLFFAPPGGFMSEHVREVALGFGVRVIRTMQWGFNHPPDLTALETVPVNRHTKAPQFQRILQGKQPQILYFGKQAAKALVPARAYEKLRNLIFKLSRRN